MGNLNLFEMYPNVNPDVIIATAKCNILELILAIFLWIGLIYLGNRFRRKKTNLKTQKTIIALICIGVILTMTIAGALTIATQFR